MTFVFSWLIYLNLKFFAKVLHEFLVKPLPMGCRLTVSLDYVRVPLSAFNTVAV